MPDADRPDAAAPGLYDLDVQVGFMLRQAYQRHAAVFAAAFGDAFTPTQWAAIAKLAAVGPCSQNQLGRLTAMDVATIKGVVERLARRTLVALAPDPTDRRRLVISLTPEGRAAYERLAETAAQVSAETLAPLAAQDRAIFQRLLAIMR